MLFLIALVGAAVVALVLWKAMSEIHADVTRANRSSTTPRRPLLRPRPSRPFGPDDDPEFLRQLDEKVRRRQDPQS